VKDEMLSNTFTPIHGDFMEGLKSHLAEHERWNRERGIEGYSVVVIPTKGRTVWELGSAVRYIRSRGYEAFFELIDGRIIDSREDWA
jgi:hypothetical protein